jgi:VIT1/CCC1 family predicted Fe2+/Mn2+ transporter
MMPDMPTNLRSPAPHSPKANSELLQKSVFLLFIGLAVLIGPHFMAPSGLRDMVASSAVVGWFALVLGGAFGVLYGLRRRHHGPPR